MTSAHPDPAEVLHRVRQQLILAQVRIMELEDVRDETAARLGDAHLLLRAAQALADQKLDEAAHTEETRANVQAQYDHLRHVQHVTHEALEAARGQLTAAERALAAEKQLVSGLGEQLHRFQETSQRLETQLRDASTTLAARQQRIEQLDTEVRAVRSSRSWRWTAWLRSLERAFGGNKP